MAKTPAEMMEKMVAPTREHCPEPVRTAMVCSHAGSMKGVLLHTAARVGGGLFGGLAKTSDLPNPVLIAVGDQGVYAFKFKPRGFSMKVKQEVRRWKRSEVAIEVGDGTRIRAFSLCAPEGYYDFEVTTMGSDRADEFLERFIDSIGRLPTA